MHELDAATAFAGVEKRLLARPLSSTYPACIWLFGALLATFRIRSVGRVIGDSWLHAQSEGWIRRGHLVRETQRLSSRGAALEYGRAYSSETG